MLFAVTVASLFVSSNIEGVFEMEAGAQIDVHIQEPGITFLIPDKDRILADVYWLNGDTEHKYGTFGGDSRAFGAYFPTADGRITIRAIARTRIRYFAFDNRRKCFRIVVTTRPNDVFMADKDSSEPNINTTIRDNQRLCMFHMSDVEASVSISHVLEDDFDFLYVRHARDDEHALTGYNKFMSKGTMTHVTWRSDGSTLSSSFSIMWRSKSKLPARCAAFGVGQIWENPRLVVDESLEPNTWSWSPDGEVAKWWTRNGGSRLVMIIAAGVLAVAITVIVLLVMMKGSDGRAHVTFEVKKLSQRLQTTRNDMVRLVS